MKPKVLPLFLLGFFLFISCGKIKKIGYSEFNDFGYSGMMPSVVYEYFPCKVLEKDSIDKIYDINLVVKYSLRCHSETLPLEMEVSSLESDTIITEHIDVQLFDKDGVPKGKGNYGVYEKIIPLRKRAKIEEGQSISFSTPMPEAKGIVALGVVCEKPDK